jgi:DNA-binding Lrp family transcriptional regulator
MSDARQFTPLEKKIIHELQQDLPVVKRPFAAVAESVGISEAELLNKVREFIADDIIRRFGATLRHQRSGFDANHPEAPTFWIRRQCHGGMGDRA